MILCENPSMRRSCFSVVFFIAISQQCCSENQPEPLLDLNMELGAVKCVQSCSSCTKHANSEVWSPKSDVNRDRREPRRFPAAICQYSTKNIVVKRRQRFAPYTGFFVRIGSDNNLPEAFQQSLETLHILSLLIIKKINQVLYTPNRPRQSTGK